jgi:hypothetical protein
VTQRSLFILVAVLIDAAITIVVLRAVLKKMGFLQLFRAGLEKSRALASETRDLVGNYVRANYSGNPEDLPALLQQLMVQIDQKACERGLKLERPMLKLLLAQALRAEDGVPMNDVQNALRKVA